MEFKHLMAYAAVVRRNSFSKAAEEFIERVGQNPQWNYEIEGILDDFMEEGLEYDGIHVLGNTDSLARILSHNGIDEIAITLSLKEYGRLEEIVNMCEKSGVHTKFIPDYAGPATSEITDAILDNQDKEYESSEKSGLLHKKKSEEEKPLRECDVFLHRM